MSKPREPNGVEPERSEEDIQREQLGPRGVPGAPDRAKMTPQREKKTSPLPAIYGNAKRTPLKCIVPTVGKVTLPLESKMQ